MVTRPDESLLAFSESIIAEVEVLKGKGAGKEEIRRLLVPSVDALRIAVDSLSPVSGSQATQLGATLIAIRDLVLQYGVKI